VDTYGTVVCKVWFPDQQQEQNHITSHHMRTYKKYKRLGPTPNLLNQKTELAACALTKAPGDYDTRQNWRPLI